VQRMFSRMIKNWFAKAGGLSEFVRAMLEGDARGMSLYLNEIMLNSMSSFDGGNLSIKLPENFYHGLVLGLLVENSQDYRVTSNRESGYGRYDVVMEPKEVGKPAAILEFKVFDPLDNEKGLKDTAENALKQIEERHYEVDLLAKVPAENILKYGFAFRGKKCLIRKQ
ncbi:MAG: PD-(D/E)XK nuclease domain-containing protein, partial [Clostridia bacterium]|nr:PD-(D/E)XK nuclease domain-containing protein [Clostridia bacterium]